MSTRAFIVTLVGCMSLLSCKPSTPGCKTDQDCKGDRICSAGECADPKPRPAPADSGRASTAKVDAGSSGAPDAGSLASHACPDGMVAVPGGTFDMGSDRAYPKAAREVGFDSRDGYGWRPRHRVTMSPYCIDQFEVSVRRYKLCVDSGKCTPPGMASGAGNSNWGVAGRESDPITLVSYEQALGFCRANGGSLPTEAQWEYAARGTDGREYPWPPSSPDETFVCEDSLAAPSGGRRLAASFGEASRCFKGVHGTWPVGSAPAGASPFGALDMAGNVMEWVEDIFDAAFYARSPTADPRNPPTKLTDGTNGVVRGGGWSHGGGEPNLAPAWNHRTYWREPMPYYQDGKAARDAEIGFRCAAAPLIK